MILLHLVIHVLTGPALAFIGQGVVSLKLADGANLWWVLINVDHLRGGDVRSSQAFSEKPLGCSGASGLIQEEIECLAG